MSSHNVVIMECPYVNRTVFVHENVGNAFKEKYGIFVAPYRGWYHFHFLLEMKNPLKLMEVGLAVTNGSGYHKFWVCLERRHADGKVEGSCDNKTFLEEGDVVGLKVEKIDGPQVLQISQCSFEGSLVSIK